MPLWGGRFQQSLDAEAWKLNASIDFDRRMWQQDIRGSQAWARALAKAGVLAMEEAQALEAGLQSVAGEFASGSFVFQPGDEDIHTAVERRLGEIVGPVAGKLHTGRSRNDQVATDTRLWLLDHLTEVDAALVDLQQALIARADADFNIIVPGYTHLQPAQPILLSHWWLAHFWPLQRDRQRLADLRPRLASLPLGAAALAGTSFPIDRAALAADLGFSMTAPNSLDAVADRDFIAEFLFCATLCGVHLSHLAEGVIIFSSAEFGFIELSDAFATGSSLMPQKKNPDVFELARGKAGTLIGLLTGLLATLKGLPSAYDKDLQEDKPALFAAFDTLTRLLPVLAGALHTLKVHPLRMQQRLDPALLATDLADYLVRKGLPFRQAHSIVGQAVQRAATLQVTLDQLPLSEYQTLSPLFEAQVIKVFDPLESVARRDVIGGTAPQRVQEQIALAKQKITN